jgi:hypothetical protein
LCGCGCYTWVFICFCFFVGQRRVTTILVFGIHFVSVSIALLHQVFQSLSFIFVFVVVVERGELRTRFDHGVW